MAQHFLAKLHSRRAIDENLFSREPFLLSAALCARARAAQRASRAAIDSPESRHESLEGTRVVRYQPLTEPKPQPLDYEAAPRPAEEPPRQSATAGCSGMVVGLFGLLFLIRGIVSALQIFKGIHRFFRSDHANFALIGLVVGVPCLFFAIRWLRYAWCGRTGR